MILSMKLKKRKELTMNMITEIGCVALTAILSILTLFLLTKLIGYQQISQLSMFDYINGITIGSIAAELATDLENWHKSLTALIVYGIITYLIAIITNKSIRLRRFIDGRSMIIYENNMLYQKNLAKAHIDISQFLSLCRCQGYFDLQDIHIAILEPNGTISIVPKVTKRPTNPEDFGLNPTQDFPLASVIIDGEILYHNLKATGNDEKWLIKQIHAKGVKDLHDIMLATCSVDNQVEVYIKNTSKSNEDIFE